MTQKHAPAEEQALPARILVFTGDGKGKTTAAMGMALRAAGHGMPTRIIQFLKADDSTGELTAFKAFPHVHMHQVGKGFVPKPNHPHYPCHQTAAHNGLKMATEALQSGAYQLVVLDEICTAIALGLLHVTDVTAVVSLTHSGTVLVLTGRGAPPALIALADTVTRMECIKHGMTTGHKAQQGVEF
jgi:cob(I)alamin adenosyltransferase